MARVRIPDGGIPFRGGRPPRTNTNLGIRPEAGRAPNLPSGRTPGVRTEATLDAASNAGGGVGDWIMGGISMIPGFGTAIAAGGAIGGWMENNLPQNTAGSGRGAGRTAFNPPKPQTPAQPRKVTPAGNYTVAGVTYDATTGQAINPDTGKTSSGGYSLDPKTGARTDYAAGTGRGAGAPDGSGAQGTQTSPRQMTMDEANSLLTGGYKVKNPFSNTQLPDTNGSPYYGNGDTPEYRSDVPEDTYDVPLSRNLTDGSPFNTGDYTYEVPTNTNIEYLQQEGRPLIQSDGVVRAAESTVEAEQQKYAKPPKRPRGERAGEMWDRKYGRMNQQSEPTESKSPNIDYARRSAFLDAPNSMQGLRRVEAQKGVVYAGGQHSLVNPDGGQEGESAFVKLDKPDRDAYMGGRMTADELKNKFVKKVSDKEEE